MDSYCRALHGNPGRDRVYSCATSVDHACVTAARLEPCTPYPTWHINDVSDTHSVSSHPVCPPRARPVYTVPILVSRSSQDILCQRDRGENRREDSARQSARTGTHCRSARTGAHRLQRQDCREVSSSESHSGENGRGAEKHLRRKESDGRHRVHVQSWILLLHSRCTFLTLTPH